MFYLGDGAVVDRDDLDEVIAVVVSVDGPVAIASRTPQALELKWKGPARPPGIIGDVANCLQHGRGGGFSRRLGSRLADGMISIRRRSEVTPNDV